MAAGRSNLINVGNIDGNVIGLRPLIPGYNQKIRDLRLLGAELNFGTLSGTRVVAKRLARRLRHLRQRPLEPKMLRTAQEALTSHSLPRLPMYKLTFTLSLR